VKHAITMLEFPDDGSTPVRVLQFNPWLFADESALFAGFSELILNEIRGWRARRNVARILKLIGPASKYGPVDISPAALVVGGMLESPSSPSSVFRALDRAMSKTKKPICIVMDDIDRLNPDELIMLFKLVRLVGNLRGVSYLLAMDENTVLELIGSTSVADSNPERARAYLEKIIDFKHRVPPLTFEQIHGRGFEEAIRFANSEGIEIHRRSYESLEWIYDQSLSRRLTTVRALDRFIAEVESISPSIYREIDFKDWCLAAFLRSQMPMVWAYVIEHKNEFLGKLSSLTLDMEKEAAKEFANKLPITLTQLGLSVDGVGIATDVLRSMFPAASLTGGSILMSGSTVDEAEARYGIGHEDFFDRYTWVGLPPTDVSDHEILTLLRGLGEADAQAEAERELLAVYRSQPNTVLERMRRNHAKEGIVKLALLKFLAGVLPKRDNMMAAFSRDRSPVVLVAGWLVGALEESEYDQVFAWAVEPGGSASDLFLELLQRRGRFWHASSPVETRMREVQMVLVDRMLALLQDAPCPTINDFPLREYAMDLRRIDEQAFGALARELINEERWRADDVVALFISRFLPMEGSAPRHLGVSERQLRAALGDDAILDMYPLEGVERSLRDCLASEDNNDYVVSDVSTMRATAAGAVAQIAEKIRAERRG